MDKSSNFETHLPEVRASDALAVDSAIRPVQLPYRKSNTVRFGVMALVIGFGGFLLWAGLAPLDEGVPGQGMIAIDTKKKAVQHLSGGLIKEVLVREGDRVKEGQLLMRLDEALANSNFQTARRYYLSLRSIEARLLADQRGLRTIAFDTALTEPGDEQEIRQLMSTQEQLLHSRQSSLRADLQAIEESIQGQSGRIRAYETMLGNRRSHLASLTEESTNVRGLVEQGYAPRTRLLELERQQGDDRSNLADLAGNINAAQRAIAEFRQRIIVRQQEYRKEVESQLSELQREIPGATERYRVVKEDLGRIDIKSPATGQVVGLAYQSVGGVVPPGQKLMDIVPEGQSLLIEARVAPQLIDRVHQGLAVDVRFSSFAKSPQLVVSAKVVSVSTDLLTDQSGAAGYYLARVAVTPEGHKKLGGRQLQSGMPVEVIFLTGERSLLAYLWSPLSKRLAASMKEE
jgi:protease secretion system membrane fusion protein